MCQGAQPPWGAVAGSRAHQMIPSSLKLPLGHAVSCPYVCHDSGQSTCARTQNFQGVSPPTSHSPGHGSSLCSGDQKATSLERWGWTASVPARGTTGCPERHGVDREAGLRKRRAWQNPGLHLALCSLVVAGAGRAPIQGPHPGPQSTAPRGQVGVKVRTHRLQGRDAFLSQGLILRFSTSGHQSLATAQPKKCSCYAHPGGDILSSLARNLAGPQLTLPVRATKVGA